MPQKVTSVSSSTNASAPLGKKLKGHSLLLLFFMNDRIQNFWEAIPISGTHYRFSWLSGTNMVEHNRRHVWYSTLISLKKFFLKTLAVQSLHTTQPSQTFGFITVHKPVSMTQYQEIFLPSMWRAQCDRVVVQPMRTGAASSGLRMLG